VDFPVLVNGISQAFKKASGKDCCLEPEKCQTFNYGSMPEEKRSYLQAVQHFTVSLGSCIAISGLLQDLLPD
jgi:hypothetical protein